MNFARRRARRLTAGLAALWPLAGLAAVNFPGVRRPGRRPGRVVGHQRHRLRRATGRRRIYVGGSFTQAGPNTGFGVALDPSTGAWCRRSQDQRHRPRRRARRRRRFLYRGRLHPGRRPIPPQRRPRHSRRHPWHVGGGGLEPRDRQADPGHRPRALGHAAYIGGDFATVQGVARAGDRRRQPLPRPTPSSASTPARGRRPPPAPALRHLSPSVP